MSERGADEERDQKRALRVATSALTIYVLYAMGLLALQRQLLFPTHYIPAPPPRPTVPNVEVLYVPHADGRTEGWFVPGRGVDAEAPGPVVFFAHGNAELIDFNAPMLLWYVDRGVSLAMCEYRGYGRSDGAPSQEGIVADTIAFHDLVTARPDVDPTRVVLHGRSLGGGVMAQVAAQREPRGMVLESTFRSVKVMARRFLMPGFLVLDPFDSEAVLRELDVPLLLFHGTRDEVIPYEHGVALAALSRDARLVSFECGHNDLPPASAPYWKAIGEHLAAAGVLR